jgi:hypothetical protein
VASHKVIPSGARDLLSLRRSQPPSLHSRSFICPPSAGARLRMTMKGKRSRMTPPQPLATRHSPHVVAVSLLCALAACSPESRRVRDGGPGADPGNKVLVTSQRIDPHAADTTLWPGKAPAPVDRLAAGERPPPAQISPSPAPKQPNRAVTPNTPAAASEQRTFDKSRSPNPRRPSSRPPF